MLVSTKHKFAFLSNRKCASSSLIESLGPYCDITMGRDHRLRHLSFGDYQKHVLPLLVEKVGGEARDYQVFCLFREPVDWLFSWYRFRTREEISPTVTPNHWEYTGNISWSEFLDECLKERPAAFADLPPQHHFVQGMDGTSDGLTIFPYEEFDRFLEAISARIGEPVDVVNWNVSPKLQDGPTKADYRRCRKALAADYQIYDAIRKNPEAPGFVGKVVSKIKKTIPTQT